MAGAFFNELLDQRLRALIQQESEPVRNLILAHALSRTSLLDPAQSTPLPTARAAADHTPNDIDALGSALPTATTAPAILPTA